ncbi:hypothetical protein [Oceanospirillum multiglobuliferum]|uniref:Uncharacterized protein n=1 Tax=Oceanospirillum multiglobuliferum TaxID=64969 RepID=A0A1V4TB01_9GAMM|nr:hypothetical protein [Oceanospirillum multiglobuliferum]OPX57040.1 hypothetical protein BTE48_01010 [Oceanospirillum multiglobuliferum]
MLDKYEKDAAAMAEELSESLDESEIEILRAVFETTAPEDWLQWKAHRAADVVAFVQATPSQRRKKVRWKEEYPFYAYAGYLHCVKAYALLRALSRYNLSPGGSFRRVVADAGLVYDHAADLELQITCWPWENPPKNWLESSNQIDAS